MNIPHASHTYSPPVSVKKFVAIQFRKMLKKKEEEWRGWANALIRFQVYKKLMQEGTVPWTLQMSVKNNFPSASPVVITKEEVIAMKADLLCRYNQLKTFEQVVLPELLFMSFSPRREFTRWFDKFYSGVNSLDLRSINGNSAVQPYGATFM